MRAWRESTPVLVAPASPPLPPLNGGAVPTPQRLHGSSLLAAHRCRRSCPAVDHVVRFGGLDVALLCAGIGERGDFLEASQSTSALEKTLAIDLTAVIAGTRAVAQAMIEAGKGGRIISIASAAGGLGDSSSIAAHRSLHTACGGLCEAVGTASASPFRSSIQPALPVLCGPTQPHDQPAWHCTSSSLPGMPKRNVC